MASKIAAKNILHQVANSGRPLLFGMVHLRALPGCTFVCVYVRNVPFFSAPRAELCLDEISKIATREARILANSGCVRDNLRFLIEDNLH